MQQSRRERGTVSQKQRYARAAAAAEQVASSNAYWAFRHRRKKPTKGREAEFWSKQKSNIISLRHMQSQGKKQQNRRSGKGCGLGAEKNENWCTVSPKPGTFRQRIMGSIGGSDSNRGFSGTMGKGGAANSIEKESNTRTCRST
jgi:hypothetical protein